MAEVTPGSAKHAGITGDELRTARFGKAFGRGYEQGEVDKFIETCAAWIDWLNEQLKASERRSAELQEQAASSVKGAEVQQAISILTGAQQAADTAVRQADQYSATVMAEAKEFYEQTRRRALSLEHEAETKVTTVSQDAIAKAETLEREASARAQAVWETASGRAAALERESERKAKALMETAQRRADSLNQETQARRDLFNAQAAAEQEQLERQTAYLRNLRDTSQIQMQKFLEGMLDHVLDEYGQASPLAAEAATAPHRPSAQVPAGGPLRISPDRRRTRRPSRVAGQNPGPFRQGVPSPRGENEPKAQAETNGGENPVHSTEPTQSSTNGLPPHSAYI